jgi:hypothetical protein
LQGEIGESILTKLELGSKDGLEAEAIKVYARMRRRANARLDNLDWTRRAWNAAAAYAESKFLDVLIAIGVALPDRRLA